MAAVARLLGLHARNQFEHFDDGRNGGEGLLVTVAVQQHAPVQRTQLAPELLQPPGLRFPGQELFDQQRVRGHFLCRRAKAHRQELIPQRQQAGRFEADDVDAFLRERQQ